MNGVLDVARLQLSTWPGLLIGWGIVALSFGINVLVAAVADDVLTTGGLAIPFIFALVIGATLVQQWWPFAAGLSVTRRQFYLAGLLLGLGYAALTATVVLILTAVEDLTGGWGVSLVFFGLAPLVLGSLPAQWAALVAVFLLAWAAGLLVAGVGKRWGTVGVMVALASSVVVLGAVAAPVTVTGSWPDVAAWVQAQPTVLLAAVVPLVLAGGGWLVLRRAAP